MAGLTTYQQRKLEQRCTRCGDALPDEADTLLCPRCLKRERKRVAAANSKRRKKFGRKRCRDCGRPASGRYCTKHRIAHNLRRLTFQRAAVTNAETNAEQISARTWTDAGNRTRYHGQEQRGRQSNAALDEQDISYAIDALLKADKGRVVLEIEGENTSKMDRAAAKRVWLSQVDHAIRFAEGILDRHDYSPNIVEMVPGTNRRRR